MSFIGFLRLVDPNHPAFLLVDIIMWSVCIILFVFAIVVLLIRKYK